MGRAHGRCSVCDSSHLEYEFAIDKSPVCVCQDCGLLFINPQPDPAPVRRSTPAIESNTLSRVYAANAVERMRELIAYSRKREGKLLLIGADTHLSAEARRIGFEVYDYSASQFESLSPAQLPASIQACVLFCALERMRDPLAKLQMLHGLLDVGGCLMVISPTTDSRAARLLRTSWWEFNQTNLFYFSVDTLQSLLIKAGFGDPIVAPDRSLASVNYLRERLAENPHLSRRFRLLRNAMSLSPMFRNSTFRPLHGRTRFLVRSKIYPSQPRLSVIVPVYNERATFLELIEQLLLKTIDGLDLEIIIVESNSTDGSRELVLQYKDHPRVRVILEDKPLGKGHAVRTALRSTTGDLVLFQDADLEYDINDYDALVGPLLAFRNNFVLGTRHSGGKNNWKIRQFTDSPGLAAFFNFGHLLFLTLFNLLYKQRLSDPFTMFKVFRRECLYGLDFECNRFDFDYEIVIKFLRKGYKPLELPVNYRSRSMKEGKKVTVFRDPLTWILALFKFRRSPIYGRNG